MATPDWGGTGNHGAAQYGSDNSRAELWKVGGDSTAARASGKGLAALAQRQGDVVDAISLPGGVDYRDVGMVKPP